VAKSDERYIAKPFNSNNLMNEYDLKSSTHKLVHAVMFGSEVSEQMRRDFGINSDAHFEVLRQAIRHKGLDVEALNNALGHGEEITNIMNRTGCNPDGLVFRTAWDEFCERYGQKERRPAGRDQQRERGEQKGR
jgi:hypothetical protein